MATILGQFWGRFTPRGRAHFIVVMSGRFCRSACGRDYIKDRHTEQSDYMPENDVCKNCISTFDDDR